MTTFLNHFHKHNDQALTRVNDCLPQSSTYILFLVPNQKICGEPVRDKNQRLYLDFSL